MPGNPLCHREAKSAPFADHELTHKLRKRIDEPGKHAVAAFADGVRYVAAAEQK
jgi:hypothetical protein